MYHSSYLHNIILGVRIRIRTTDLVSLFDVFFTDAQLQLIENFLYGPVRLKRDN